MPGDNDEFKKAFSAVRPKLKVPTRRTMSGRILDKGTEKAEKARNAIIAGSQGVCDFLDMCYVAYLFAVWDTPCYTALLLQVSPLPLKAGQPSASEYHVLCDHHI